MLSAAESEQCTAETKTVKDAGSVRTAPVGSSEASPRTSSQCLCPKLPTSAQVEAPLSGHLGYSFLRQRCLIRSAAISLAVASFAEDNEIPWVKLGKVDVGAKLELMRLHLNRQAAMGVAQQFQRFWTCL